MKNRSILEDIIEASFRSPVAGFVISVFFAGLGLYLTNKDAPVGAKPAAMILLPVEHMFGTVCYLLSGIVLILAGIGYVVTFDKRKIRKTNSRTNISDLPKNLLNKTPRFKTKEEYFSWKEDAIRKSSDNQRNDAVPQSIPSDDNITASLVPNDVMQTNEILWTFDCISKALDEIDWYQFEKFSAALLTSEGYTVKRKGGAQPDGGVDLIATKDSDTLLVQCKHWKTWEIKPKTVREMVGTMKINHADRGAIYTLKGASKAALELAAQQGIRIEENNGLAARALSLLSKEQLDSILKTDVHHCPKCEAEMVWRAGKFKPFWGCSRYPRCRGKLEYSGAR